MVISKKIIIFQVQLFSGGGGLFSGGGGPNAKHF